MPGQSLPACMDLTGPLHVPAPNCRALGKAERLVGRLDVELRCGQGNPVCGIEVAARDGRIGEDETDQPLVFRFGFVAGGVPEFLLDHVERLTAWCLEAAEHRAHPHPIGAQARPGQGFPDALDVVVPSAALVDQRHGDRAEHPVVMAAVADLPRDVERLQEQARTPSGIHIG